MLPQLLTAGSSSDEPRKRTRTRLLAVRIGARLIIHTGAQRNAHDPLRRSDLSSCALHALEKRLGISCVRGKLMSCACCPESEWWWFRWALAAQPLLAVVLYCWAYGA